MKKAVVFLLVVMILNIGITCFAFDDVPNELRQVTDTLTNYSILNGYEDGTFKPDNAITRAEFAKVIVCTANLFCDARQTPGFSDIENHWAKDYILIAKSKGIIDGVSVAKFAPDDSITNEQAIKMIVCMLGYKKEAEKLGGYPNGYINMGEQLGITKGLDILPTNNTTRGTVAKMVFNALDVSYRVIDENGTVVNEITDNFTLRKLQEDILKINSFSESNQKDVG